MCKKAYYKLCELNSCFLLYLLAYRLEFDNSWTPIDDTKKYDERSSLIQQVMTHKLALKDAIQ